MPATLAGGELIVPAATLPAAPPPAWYDRAMISPPGGGICPLRPSPNRHDTTGRVQDVVEISGLRVQEVVLARPEIGVEAGYVDLDREGLGVNWGVREGVFLRKTVALAERLVIEGGEGLDVDHVGGRNAISGIDSLGKTPSARRARSQYRG